MRLSCIVRRPVLGIGLAGDFDGFCNNRLTVSGLLTFDRVFNCKDVLTLIVTEFIVATSSLVLIIMQGHRILLLLVALRRNAPSVALAY